MLKILFWISLIMILYTYIGYPILITIAAKWKTRLLRLAAFGGGLAMTEGVASQPPCNDEELPTVSVVISVYNEEDAIQRKLENCLGIDYPKDKLEILVGSDGSTDGTNEILRKHHVKIFISEERNGKPETLNRLVKEAKGEILFFTDARQEIEKDAVKKLVRNFADPKIGCVSGELVYEKKESITARGIGTYWEYEKYIREMESRVHSMIGATGAIYACRKSLYTPIPEDIILDDVWVPLSVVDNGYRAIFDREAKAYDIFAEIPHDEHRRKVRTLSGNYQIFSKMPYMMNPVRSKLALQIISHKLLRVAAPFFMLALFISNLVLAGETLYKMFFMAQCLFYGIALAEAIFRRHIKKIFGIPYLFCLLNFSALVGLWDFLFGRADIKWEKAR